jgi:flagellin-like hook-associated protein FlgL
MAILPTSLGRVSNQLRSNTALNQITRTQNKLMRAQNELTTGKRLNAPSDDPGDAALALQIRKTLEKREAFSSNLSNTKNQLSEVDSTLGDVSDLLLQAQQTASANVGDGITQDQRESAAEIVKSIYTQLVSLGNKSFGGNYLFAGDKLDRPPFEENTGGVKFIGSSTKLLNQVDEAASSAFQVDGAEVWGALSTRIEGATTLGPSLDAATRLRDLNGATGQGVRPGVIRLGNGTVTAAIDLNNADSVDDVITAINAAGVGGITAGLNAAGTGIQFTAGASDDITVSDVGGGSIAADLGIAATAGGAGVDVVGMGVGARVTTLTQLSDLAGGGGLDLSGLTITNGGASDTISFAGAVTVEDVLNKINASPTGVKAEINAAGTGLRLMNPTQGTEMRISENGGNTATELGLRSFSPDAKLMELNEGRGVRTVDGADFRITDSAGAAFDVDLSAAHQTVQDVLDAINAAATTAGAGVTASFAATGNGIVLTDTAAGGATLRLDSQNYSNAGIDLGIDGTAVGGVIAGKDVHPVVAQGVFANLAKLQAAMQKGDQKAITAAAEALQGDYDRVVRVRGQTGAAVQEVESRQDRLTDENLSTKTLLSQLEDLDFTEAISKFSLLQTSLQASLQTTGKTLDMSLIDFLR